MRQGRWRDVYARLRSMSDEELQVWTGEHPGDVARIRNAVEKRRRRARGGAVSVADRPLPMANEEETSHAAG